MDQAGEVCVLIPTYNEAEAIGSVIERFHEAGLSNILVIDGGSEDGTREIAEDLGARVVQQRGDGKGQAVREAVREHITEPYVLLVDGDATYRPEEAERLLEPLLAGEAEHVIGNRFADMQPGAMSRLNRAGNSLINQTFELVHGRDLVDILSGYRAFTRESFDRLALSAGGFGIETEMSVECVRHDVTTAVVPITYESRPEGSETNLRPFRDGATIFVTMYRMAKKNNPIFYFGSVGALSMLMGFFLAAFVAFRWVFYDVAHQVIALASGVALLFGIQLFMFGILSDLIVANNRQQRRRLDRLEQQLDRMERHSEDAPTEPSASPAEGTRGRSEDGEEEASVPSGES